MSKKTLQQFINDTNGKSVDFDGYYGAQCVDFFNFYNRDVVGAPRIGTPRTNGARDLWEVPNADRDHFYERLPRGVALRAGDVLVYGQPYGRIAGNNGYIYYGHVRVMTSPTQYIAQNDSAGARVAIATLGARDELGVLRPRNEVQPAPAAPTPPAPSQPAAEYVTAQPGFTMWGYENEHGVPFGTLQRLNPGVNPRTIQIGQKIRVR